MLFLGQPIRGEKVVEGTDSGDVARLKSALNGMQRNAIHLFDPHRSTYLWFGHEKQEEGAKQRCRNSGCSPDTRIAVLNQYGNTRYL